MTTINTKLPYWHHQLVLSWYHHQPESHQQSFTKLLEGVRDTGTCTRPNPSRRWLRYPCRATGPPATFTPLVYLQHRWGAEQSHNTIQPATKASCVKNTTFAINWNYPSLTPFSGKLAFLISLSHLTIGSAWPAETRAADIRSVSTILQSMEIL